MKYPLHLFEAYGVELEYMIVDKDTLKVSPIADKVLESIAGTYTNEVDRGLVAWSNELVLHVVELKTNGPAKDLSVYPNAFQNSINEINAILHDFHAQLMPTAAHPFMDPNLDTRLWPHEQTAIYHSYNRIFDCTGHGWSNLQSTHINLPFASDLEFGKLHTAIRLLLPLMPALTASSPIIEGKITGLADTRLEFYRKNQIKIPSITGQVVPEAVTTIQEYQDQILRPIYQDIAPYDLEGILQEEWLNSRGAIARFDRGAIEIRVLDIQECPLADLAIVHSIISALKALVYERWTSFEEQKKWSEKYLSSTLLDAIKDGSETVISDPDFLTQFGVTSQCSLSLRELWRHIIDEIFPYREPENELFRAPMGVILDHGTLSERILKSVGNRPDKNTIEDTYRRLCEHLASGTMFIP